MLSSRELYERAVGHANAGRLGTAQRLLDRVTSREAGVGTGTGSGVVTGSGVGPTPDPDLPALVLGTRAFLLAQRGDPAGAAALCRTALDLPSLSSETTAILSGQLALALIHAGDLLAAGPVLDVAAQGLEDQPARLAQVLLNRGMVAMELDDLVVAQRCFDRAVQLFDDLDNEIGAAKARHNSATVSMLRGDLVTALREMDRAREVLAPLSPAAAATCESDRAELLVIAGMPREAVAPLERAALAYGKAGMRRSQAGVELLLARTVLDQRQAISLARRSAARFARAGDAAGALRAQALRAELSLQAPVPRAGDVTAAHELAAALDAAGLREVSRGLRRNLVRGHVRRGEFDAARSLLATLRPSKSEHVTARVLHAEVAAEVAAGEGRHRIAQRRAAHGMELVAGWSDRYEDLDLRTALAMHARRVLVTGITSALATGDPWLVLHWSELTRGVASRPTPVRTPSGLDLTAARRDADPIQRPLAAAPGSAWREGERDPAAEAAPGPIDPDLLFAVLREQHAVALAYVRTDDDVAVVTLDPAARGGRGGATLTRLASWHEVEGETSGLLADLDMAASTLHPILAASVHTALMNRLGRLQRLLVPADLPAGTRLVITAPPAVGAVPWTLLPRLSGRAVSVPETLADWIRRARAGATAPKSAGVVVGPRLAHAEGEADSVAGVWGERCARLEGDSAGVAAVSSLAASVDVLHVVAHGHHAVSNPLFSGFELADGPWFGYDIELLPRVPQVVVLSACELGRSSQVWGMELVGMARAWLHAGVRVVVAAPARVPDAVSTAIPALHRALAQGRGPAEELAMATAESTGSESVGGPVGAFTCFGNGW